MEWRKFFKGSIKGLGISAAFALIALLLLGGLIQNIIIFSAMSISVLAAFFLLLLINFGRGFWPGDDGLGTVRDRWIDEIRPMPELAGLASSYIFGICVFGLFLLIRPL